MGEFANAVRRQAFDTLRSMFHREPPGDTDPILELMAILLEDGAGGIDALAEAPVTTDQWLSWNRLVTRHMRALARMVTRELEREQSELPVEREAMRVWASRLLLSTLDRMGMS
jgi:hypothetical protein